MKEIIFSVVMISLIFGGNAVTQEYLKKSIENASQNLIKLKEDISKEDEINKDDVNKKIESIHREWDDRYEILAFFIEHDELEKIETELTDIQARIKTEEYQEAIPEIDKGVFILRHIKEKNSLSFKNIF